jgi:ribosomal protein S18 acetylase RimI-like enzyme
LGPNVRDEQYDIEVAVTADALREVRGLLREYVEWLRVDLGFEEEDLTGFPGGDAPAAGAILVARGSEGIAVGCVAFRPLDEPGACEMKRLYVRETARSSGLGRRLAVAALEKAGELGYVRMRLDTLAPMKAAQAMYRSLGFEETPPYYADPVPDMIFMARKI